MSWENINPIWSSNSFSTTFNSYANTEVYKVLIQFASFDMEPLLRPILRLEDLSSLILYLNKC